VEMSTQLRSLVGQFKINSHTTATADTHTRSMAAHA
jgi:hypothetical protein